MTFNGSMKFDVVFCEEKFITWFPSIILDLLSLSRLIKRKTTLCEDFMLVSFNYFGIAEH